MLIFCKIPTLSCIYSCLFLHILKKGNRKYVGPQAPKVSSFFPKKVRGGHYHFWIVSAQTPTHMKLSRFLHMASIQGIVINCVHNYWLFI